MFRERRDGSFRSFRAAGVLNQVLVFLGLILPGLVGVGVAGVDGY